MELLMAILTLSVDEKSTERARVIAQEMGTSLNQFLRDQIDRLAGADQREHEAKAYLASAGAGNSRNWKHNRRDLQRKRLLLAKK
jgi:hypothetical protein